MEAIGFVVLTVGLIGALVGAIMMLVAAFKETIWWGLGGLFIPLVLLIFVIMHWDVTKKGFVICLIGWVVYFVGSMIALPSLIEAAQTQGLDMGQ